MCQVATVVVETTQLVLSQFKNFYRINWVSKCCELLVKLCHINRSPQGATLKFKQFNYFTFLCFVLFDSLEVRTPGKLSQWLWHQESTINIGICIIIIIISEKTAESASPNRSTRCMPSVIRKIRRPLCRNGKLFDIPKQTCVLKGEFWLSSPPAWWSCEVGCTRGIGLSSRSSSRHCRYGIYFDESGQDCTRTKACMCVAAL